MNDRRAAVSVTAIVSLAWVIALQAHHSSSMFDIARPVWIEGTVVRYDAVNPHATMVLEESGADGEVRRWTVEGPHLRRLGNMGVQPQVGDRISVCGFSLREGYPLRSQSPDPYGMSGQFVHGHALLMPDGHVELFGPYGSLAECIRSSDGQQEAWLDFLNNSHPSVHFLWCGQRRYARLAGPDSPIASSVGLFDEINGLMDDPCP